MVCEDGGLVASETTAIADAETAKQMATGTIPGPTMYSPP